MKTIIYQGQPIEVELINEMNGNLTVATRPDWELSHDGTEEIFRDAEGQYYLRRKLRLLDHNGEDERSASRRAFVHHISLRTAILWAIMRANPESTGLRRDALAALEVPKTLNAIRDFADGSMAVTLHLKPQPARLFRAACLSDDQDPVYYIYYAISTHVVNTLSGGTREREGENEKVFNDFPPDEAPKASTGYLLRLVDASGMTVEEGSINNGLAADIRSFVEDWKVDWSRVVTRLLERGRDMTNNHDFIVEMDGTAIALLERYKRPKDITTWDVVNGVVVNWLEAVLQVHEGRTDEAAITEAMWRRTGITEPKEDEGDDTAQLEGRTVRLLWNKDGSEFDEVALDPGVYEEIEAHGRKHSVGFAAAMNDWLLEALETLSAVQSKANRQENLCAYLDEETAKLVARFQEASPRIYSTADIISGCVHHALRMALHANKEERNHPRHKGRRFPDNGWGYVERDIANVRQRREGKPEFDGDEPKDDAETDAASTPFAGRRPVANPDDIALLAAAEPEPIDDPPTTPPAGDKSKSWGYVFPSQQAPVPPKAKRKRSGKGKEGK